ncbi:Uncharacterized protein SCF082_LOCUS42981 [Durusdinium trenchii]
MEAIQAQMCHSLEDEFDEVMEPPLDEFDMWDHQQALSAERTPQKRAMISHLQKSFLEQLHSECDLNEAAANAIRSLKGFTPGSSPGSPPTISSGEFAIFDEEDRMGQDCEVDAFDLFAARSASIEAMDDDRKRLVGKMQAAFLDALNDQDANGAAAAALKNVLGSSASARSQRAKELFQTFYRENLEQLNDANAAAASA